VSNVAHPAGDNDVGDASSDLGVGHPVDFFDLARHQRAHRAFRDNPVSDATVERLLVAATHAPSAENCQPWEFVVVREPQTRAALGSLMAEIWQSVRAYSESRLDPTLFADVDAGLAGGGVAAAPVLIVVCVDTDRVHPGAVASSAFPAVQNLLLAATALGLGSALTTIATQHAARLRGMLGLAEGIDPVAVVPIGHPVRALGPSRREPPRITRR
jgi:nitroreductase